MKKITFLFLLIIAQTSISQTLQMPNIPAEGVNYETSTLNAYLSVSTEGPPWDFSNLNPVDQSVISMQSIDDSPFSSSNYPYATHVKYEDGYEFFLGFESTEYTYNGENSFITNSYATPLTINPYPFNVGDTHTDAVYDISFTCSGCPPYMFRDHEVETEAISSGSVTMPDGTVFENVMLVRSLAVFSDAQTGSSPCVNTRESYFLWAADIGIPLVETFSQVTTGACNFDPIQFTRFYESESDFNNGGGGTDCPDEYSLPIVWRDNFECYDPFAIDNIEGWTAIDGEGGTTWGANDVDFANESYVGSGIIWNNTQATPTGTSDISAYNSYEGNQGLYFFAAGASSTPYPNDDWMIGPEFTITGVTSPLLTFWAKSITDAYGLDRFQIGIGSSTNPDDFTIISSGAYEEAPTVWTQYQYDLSAYDGQTIRVGIHCVSNDSFVLQMDSFVVEGTLGVNDVASLDMNLYPNPVSGSFVTIQTPINGVKYVEVFDIIGNRLINTSLITDTLEISSLSTGMYLVKVTVEGQSKTSKLIIR